MVCERYQSWITDAALSALSTGHAAEFSAHVRECVACRAELNRVQMLLAAIDSGVAANMAGEPSPAIVARVRQRVAKEAGESSWRIEAWFPVAAGALVLTLAVGIWVMRRQPGSRQSPRPSDVAENSSKPAAPPPSRPSGTAAPSTEATRVGGRIHSKRRAISASPSPQVSREPEILVPPEEWSSVVDLYAAMQSGRVDGTVLVAAARNLETPLAMEKLKVAPLEIPSLEEDDN